MKLKPLTFLFLGIFAAASPAMAENERPPNIIFIMTDDHDRETMGSFGGEVKTPHIDQLAADGLRFSQFTTTSPVCTPTRYTTLSGRYAGKAQKMVQEGKKAKPNEPVSLGWNTSLEIDRPNLPKTLQAAGYRTGMVGKWHLGGVDSKSLDVPAGFGAKSKLTDPAIDSYLKQRQEKWCEAMKENFGFDYASRVYKSNINTKGKEPKAKEFHNMEWIVEGAQEFIRQSKDQPFFLYMATTVPHGPQPTPSLYQDSRITVAGLLDEAPETGMPSRTSVLERAKEAGIPKDLAWTIWLDDGIGAVRRTVEELGLLENTIIIVMSDQEAVGKGSLYDRGVGAPCIASWKGSKSAGTTSDVMAQNVDWAPTLLEIASIPLPPRIEADGKSFAPLLRGETLPADWRTSAYYEIGLMRGVRTDKFKYVAVRFPEGTKVDASAEFGTSEIPMFNQFKRREAEFPHWWDADQLYDLEKDPEEKNNLATNPEYAEVLAEMKRELSQHLKELPYGYAEFTR
ncbi:sulfatase [Luteolibacter algae]|uniref:Sulfatase n=1 Tax=Luteolibacter algae TaxID=454151 RepID=A0ABW5D336_9BACT